MTRTSYDVVISINLLIGLRCRKSLELHDKRHREIAIFVRRILRLDDDVTVPSPLSTKKRKIRKSDSTELSGMAIDSIEEELIEGGEEWADSSTIYEDDVDIKRLRTSNAKENRSIRKAQKAEKKIAKNQMRVQIITSEDVEQINQALHMFGTSLVGETHVFYDENGNGQGLLNNSTIDANIAFNTGTFKYASLRQNITVKKLAKAQGIGTPKIPDEIASWQEDPQIMETLGRLKIAIVTSSPSSRERKTILSKLCDAIHNDLMIVENEDRDTMMRMAGYWRYVNKRTYNAMIRNNQLWDWATGAKLEEIEEVDEDNDAEIEPEGLTKKADTQEVDINDRSPPVESYDADFTFAETESSLLVLHRSVADKTPVEGEFEGKADTRHLTTIHRHTSSPPEPVSPDRPYKTERVNDAFLDEREDDLFGAEEQEHEYYDKHYDYDYSEDLEYCRDQSTEHQNSTPKSLRPPRTPVSKAKTAPIISPRRRGPKATTPRTAAPTGLAPKGITPRLTAPTVTAPKISTSKVTTPKATTTPKPTPSKAKILRITIPKGKTGNAKSPRAKAARTKSAPPGNGEGISYAAMVREGIKKA